MDTAEEPVRAGNGRESLWLVFVLVPIAAGLVWGALVVALPHHQAGRYGDCGSVVVPAATPEVYRPVCRRALAVSRLAAVGLSVVAVAIALVGATRAISGIPIDRPSQRRAMPLFGLLMVVAVVGVALLHWTLWVTAISEVFTVEGD